MANRKANKDKPDKGQPDEYDRDLERDSRRATEGGPDRDAGSSAAAPRTGGQEQMHATMAGEGPQKDRKGQAQSPRELNLDQPPRHKEGHGTRPETHE